MANSTLPPAPDVVKSTVAENMFAVFSSVIVPLVASVRRWLVPPTVMAPDWVMLPEMSSSRKPPIEVFDRSVAVSLANSTLPPAPDVVKSTVAENM